MWWEIAASVALGLLVLWAAMVLAMYIAARQEGDTSSLRDLLRLVPDVVRLLRRLISDSALPRGMRIRLGLLVVYLVSPIDLVPDFIPIVGYADDAIIVALAIRSVVRAAGSDALDRHWPGTPEGLRALKRLARVPE